jgi:hypothetical protein
MFSYKSEKTQNQITAEKHWKNGDLTVSSVPHWMQVIGNTNCNIRCPFCFAWNEITRPRDQHTDLSDQAIQSLTEFIGLGTRMVEMFGGQATPATGYGLGYATLKLLLEEKGLLPKEEKGADYYIAPLSENEVPQALNLAAELRKKYVVELDLMQRNLGSQFKYADKTGAKNVIILGEDEIKSGKLTVKDMASGKESKKTRKEL